MKGTINPIEAWKILQEKKMSYMVDVRTEPESIYCGKPDLKDLQKETINIPYALYPSLRENPHFIREFNKFIFNDETVTFLICKDGTLSEKALQKLKQTNKQCFEGTLDCSEKKRCNINGWKANGLPYEDD